MKKILTLLFLMTALAANAEDYYVFTDKAGNVIENNATIICNEAEDDGFEVLLNSGLYVKNVAAPSNYQVAVEAKITQLDNGVVQLCFPTNCFSYNSKGTYGGTDKATVAQNESKSIASEWIPTAYGECVVEYTAKAFQGAFPKGNYKVTVHYSYADPAGIEAVKGGKAADHRQCYDLTGRQTKTARHGIYIVRQADGRIQKVLKR